MRSFFALSALLAIGAVVASGCKINNTNSFSCDVDDCQASCVTRGRSGGQCVGDVCECTPGDTNPNEWDSQHDDTESQTQNDTGSGSETSDTGTQHDTSSESTSESDTVSDSGTDTDTDSGTDTTVG